MPKWVLNDVAREYYMNFNLMICLLIIIHNLYRQIPNMQIDSSLQIFWVAVDAVDALDEIDSWKGPPCRLHLIRV